MMYESPIKVYEAMKLAKENEIYNAIQKIGVTVDKEELIKALAYDREQYAKGFDDGYEAGKENATVHAHWNKDGRCTNCGEHAAWIPFCDDWFESTYCHGCGAQMDEVAEDD